MPQRLHARLMLLLAAVVAAAVVLTLLAIRVSMRDAAAERIARTLHAQVVAADALVGDGRDPAARRRLRALGFEWRELLPPGERPGLRLLQRAEARLGARVPGRPLRLSGQPAQLWVQAQPPARGWIGIPVFGEPDPLRRGLVLSLLAIGVLIALAAGLFARTLTRPLRALAEAAPRIVAGAAPPAPGPGASAEIVELRRALADAAQRNRDAARERELMLAGLSHDMRTPLARLRFALALDDADARAGMERDIDELDGIIARFIEYVRDGREEAERTLDLAALVRDAAASGAHAAHGWRLELPTYAPLRGRPQTLRRALTNLLDNAVRHGAPPFAIALHRDGAHWCLTVRDAGPGVPEDALAMLGRPFQRADAARSTPGSGLGLASVARAAAQHGGALTLRNREGGGFEAELRLRGC